MKNTCRYVTGYGHYLFDKHELNCHDATCKGCQPCTHDSSGNLVRHCMSRLICGQHLDDGQARTCPRCVGQVRGNVTWINRHADLLTAAAIENSGVRSEAANLAGPAADPFAWTIHRVRQLQAGVPADQIDPEDPHHPFAVLGRWEVMLREHYQQPPPRLSRGPAPRLAQPPELRWTDLTRSANYVFAKLSLAAQDPDFAWAEMAVELSACRSHLEDILNTARRTETGAPCPTCSTTLKKDEKAPRLQKRLAEHADLTAVIAGRACTLGIEVDPATGRSRCSVCRGDDDTWHCPDVPAHWWTNPAYRERVDDDYLRNAAALTATDLQMIYGINPSTLRTWVQRDQVATRGRNTSGRQVYDVEQARVMQKTTNPLEETA